MNNEQFWQGFLKRLQEGTRSYNTPAQQKMAYQEAFNLISQPKNIISCLSVKDIQLRIELIRRFPFIAFKKELRGVAKIIRKIKK